MLKMNTFKLLTVATMAGGLFAAAQPALAETRLVTIDGSSTVFPIAEAVAMLKPGGVLGIEDHRLPESAGAERERDSGYIKVSTVRALAEKAGFEFAGTAEINANPKDTTEWQQGVWTLPPTFALGDLDKAKYGAIGESDRMTLKFVKPRH